MDVPCFILVRDNIVEYLLFQQDILQERVKIMKNTFMRGIVPLLAAALILPALQGCTPFFWRSRSHTLLTCGKVYRGNMIQGDTDIFYRDLWDAVYMVCRIKGVIRKESRSRGYLQLDVLSTVMDIRIIRMTKKINRLRITVKNEGKPRIDMAKEVFSKIIAEGARLSEQ